jgi:TPR repeat protein
MLTRASSLIREGQIASARSLLQLALRSNDPSVAFALAETYDPRTLARWRAIGITGDVERARALYKQAVDGGVAEAGARLGDLDR